MAFEVVLGDKEPPFEWSHEHLPEENPGTGWAKLPELLHWGSQERCLCPNHAE